MIFAHQNKYIAEGRTQLAVAEIGQELSKVERSFNVWKQAKLPDQELDAIKKATIGIVLVIYTNRSLLADQPLPAKNLVIINSEQHFGPLIIAQVFWLLIWLNLQSSI